MAGKIPQHFIDELLSRTDIVDVVGLRVKLKRSGSNLSACCPFHSEKTPSFTVSQTKQFYHCFGCGAHGTAIGFLMEFDGMHFVDAIETLAEGLGLEVPREGGASKGPPQADNKPLFSLLQRVASHYDAELRNSPSTICYLKNRGITGETAKRFKLGYAPDGYDSLLNQFPADKKGLISTGMVAENDRGGSYARFRDRLMFPIRDRRGRIIGFGGRVMGDKEPKYLNSPETVLFHKGSELYGLFEARKAAMDADSVLVVEGYMDVVALAEHGVENAVATLGTACNQQHCEILFRVVPGIVFCFDGDRAGRDAAWRAVQACLPCLKDGRDAHFLFLPDGEDPDSLVSEQGAEALSALLQKKVPIIDFLFNHLSHDLNIDEIGGKAQMVEKIKPLLAKIPAGVYRRLSEQRLESLIGLSLDIGPAEPAATPKTTNAPAFAPLKGLTTMRRAIILLIHHPAVVATIPADQYRVDSSLKGASLLLDLIAICQAQAGISTGALLEHFRDREEWPIVNKLAATPYMPDGSDIDLEAATPEFKHCINELNQRSHKDELSKVSPQHRTGLLGIGRNRAPGSINSAATSLTTNHGRKNPLDPSGKGPGKGWRKK